MVAMNVVENAELAEVASLVQAKLQAAIDNL
jgi:hypothetical protein